MLHLDSPTVVPSFDRCYPQIFWINFFQCENPGIKANASLLQIGSTISVMV